MYEIKRLFFDLKDSVLEVYWRTVCFGHSLLSAGKDGKKHGFGGFPGLDCFDKLEGWNWTFSGSNLMNLTSRFDKSIDLDGLVNVTNLKDKSFNDSVLLSPMSKMYAVTFCMSQVKEYFGCRGLLWKIPFINLVTVGSCPTGKLSTLSWTDEMAEQ